MDIHYKCIYCQADRENDNMLHPSFAPLLSSPLLISPLMIYAKPLPAMDTQYKCIDCQTDRERDNMFYPSFAHLLSSPLLTQIKCIYCQDDRGRDNMLNPNLFSSTFPFFSPLSWFMQKPYLPWTYNINVLIVSQTWEVLTCSFPAQPSVPSHCLSKSFDFH